MKIKAVYTLYYLYALYALYALYTTCTEVWLCAIPAILLLICLICIICPICLICLMCLICLIYYLRLCSLHGLGRCESSPSIPRYLHCSLLPTPHTPLPLSLPPTHPSLPRLCLVSSFGPELPAERPVHFPMLVLACFAAI